MMSLCFCRMQRMSSALPDENILSMKTIAGAASVIAPLVGIPSGVSEQEDGAENSSESSFDTEDGSGD